MASPSRRSGWIIAGALTACLLVAIASVLWVWLPRWAPEWVVQKSPWFGPAFRALGYPPSTYDPYVVILAERLWRRDLPGGMAALAAMQQHPDRQQREKAITLLEVAARSDPDPATLAMLVRSLQHDPDAGLRVQAMLALPYQRIPETIDILIGLLADPAPEVRAAACRRLDSSHRPSVTAALVATLRDPDQGVVIAACSSLGSPFTTEAGQVVAPLKSLLVHADPARASAAWEALWSLPHAARSSARLELIPVRTVLAWDIGGKLAYQDQRVVALDHVDRQALAWGEERIPDLVELMRGEDQGLALRACRALVVVLAGERLPMGSDGVEAGWVLRKPEQHAERERMIAAALRRGVDVQAALLAFGNIPDPAEEPAKGSPVEPAEAHHALTQRWYRMVGLRGSATPEARALAVRAIAEEQDDMALEAALNLAVLGDGRAFAPLVRLLDEGGMVGRSSAGLGVLGEQRAIEPLVRIMRERWDATEAASALGELGDLRAVEPLLAALRSFSHVTVAAAAFSLGKLGDWRATPALIGCSTHENSTVRHLAVIGLHLLRDPRAVEALIARFDDEDRDIRQQAALALSTLRDERALAPMIARLTDQDDHLVALAVAVLSESGDPRAVDPLLAALDHRAVRVAAWAAEALAKLPLTAEQRARLCSPTSSAAPATPGSTAPLP